MTCLIHRLSFLCVIIGLFYASSRVLAVDLIGFVPHYRMSSSYVNNTLPNQLEMLDAVAYFGISVNGSGNLTTTSADLNNIAAIKQKIDAMPAAQRPRLDITIGGAGEDAVFSNIANTSAKRAKFAQDLDALLDQTGAGGVQIDWEHPDLGIERSTYYPALLQRVKEEFGLDRFVGATVAPSVVISNSVFNGPNAVDSISLMTYDLGWWGTSDPANPNDGEHSLHEYVEDAAQAWSDPPGSANQRPWVFRTWGNNAPKDRLGVGLPFYGRNVFGTDAYTYAEMANGGTTDDGSYYSYLGRTVWIPGLDLVQQRVEFAAEEGLQNIIIWELAQDFHPSHDASMLRRAYETKLSVEQLPGDFNGNGKVDVDDYTTWLGALGAADESLINNNGDGGGVGLGDFELWKNSLGNTLGSGSSAGDPIPEPSTMAILGLCLALQPGRRRRPSSQY